MSRIGRKPISVPSGVVFSSKNNEIVVKGPKGTLRCNIHGSMNVDFRNSEITVKRPDDSMKSRSLHGLTRTLIYNMIEGVTNGFTRELEVNGVGYRVQKQKTDLKMNLGYSHPVVVPDTEDVSTSVSGNKIIVSGIDKQKVGQFAAMLRQKRPPEPYKGKGIKYLDEIIKRKEGKSGKGAKK